MFTQNILLGANEDIAEGHCLNCHQRTQFQLPSIRKKLLYLDQSFLSAASLEAAEPKSKAVMRLYLKIRKLKDQQKIFVVVSDIHSRETSAIPDAYRDQRQRLWAFQNDLADGSISADLFKVFIAQQRRMLTSDAATETFPVSDIGLNTPHQWRAGMRIQLTNHWRPKLDASLARSRLETNDQYRRVLEQQLTALPKCKDVFDCLNFVRELWQVDILKGIAAWRQKRDVMVELATGRLPDLAEIEPNSPFRQLIDEVVRRLNADTAIRRWLELIEGESTRFCAVVRIQTAFEAALLWQWRSGMQPSKPKTFNVEFGLSRNNDIGHVSTFVPYVDVLTTDNDMLDLCGHEPVAYELAQFPCRIFATKNYAEFDSWLDSMLAA